MTIPNVKVSDVAPAEESRMVENEIVQDAAAHIEKEILEVDQDAVVAQPTPVAPSAEAPAAPAGKKRVLIADDQKMNLMVLKAMLMKLGSFEIATAEDGKKALDILTAPDAPTFDLVLTDMWMPEMDGVGLVQAIRANKKPASIPVYVVTADVEMLKQFKETGFTGILLKPITVDKLKNIREIG